MKDASTTPAPVSWCARGMVCALLVLLTACGLNRPLARQAAALVAAARPTDVTCQRADHCAIDSPYEALADTARAANTSTAPTHYVNVLERGEDALLLRIHLIRAAK